MAYSRSKKLTTTEKKLQTIKNQLYGKETNSTTFNFKSAESMNTTSNSTSLKIETNYLKNELIKITLLAALAIGAQLILYFIFQQKLI